jgi:hypothetical protein
MADKYVLGYTGSQVDSRLARPVSISQGGTGQTSDRVSIPVTNVTSGGASEHSIGTRYYPYLAACYCRGYCKISNKAIDAYTWVTVAMVGENYLPTTDYPVPLSNNTTVGGEVRITSAGEVQVRFYTDLASTATRYVYWSGWWTTN